MYFISFVSIYTYRGFSEQTTTNFAWKYVCKPVERQNVKVESESHRVENLTSFQKFHMLTKSFLPEGNK